MSKQVVLISHGKLSAGVADAVAMVFGKNEELSYLGLAPDGNVVELIGGLRDRVAASPNDQFIVIADIFGGSVCNQSLQQLSELDNVVLLSGLSMGLVLSILAMPGELSQAQIDQAVADAQAGTKVVEFIKADAPVDNGEDDFF